MLSKTIENPLAQYMTVSLTIHTLDDIYYLTNLLEI